MSWQMSGRYIAPCSCKVGCPCALGEPDGDEGWCSGVLAFDIASGVAEGVDVSGVKVLLIADWPRGFLSGGGKGRLYFDDAASDEQQGALEPVFGGQKGGVFAAIGALVDEVMPSVRAPISFSGSDGDVEVTVGEVGKAVHTPLRGPNGDPTRLIHAAAAFRDDIMLGRGTGTAFHDPDLRAWESGGHSEFAEFAWSD